MAFNSIKVLTYKNKYSAKEGIRRKYMDANNTINIPIKNGILKVSACDYEKVIKYTWIYYKWNSTQRVSTYIDRSMHNISKIIFDVKDKQLIFHKNGDFLDYTRDNIIICTRSDMRYLLSNANENGSNEYYGVYFSQKLKKWRVSIMKRGTKKHGGNYETALDAAIVADYLANKKYGSLAKRNFPELNYFELEEKYKGIQEKYGVSLEEKLTKSRQGKVRNQNKSSKYVGVSWNKYRKKWHVQIAFKKKNYSLGFFDNELEAAKTYDTKAIELYGQYARTNLNH